MYQIFFSFTGIALDGVFPFHCGRSIRQFLDVYQLHGATSAGVLCTCPGVVLMLSPLGISRPAGVIGLIRAFEDIAEIGHEIDVIARRTLSDVTISKRRWRLPRHLRPLAMTGTLYFFSPGFLRALKPNICAIIPEDAGISTLDAIIHSAARRCASQSSRPSNISPSIAPKASLSPLAT